MANMCTTEDSIVIEYVNILVFKLDMSVCDLKQTIYYKLILLLQAVALKLVLQLKFYIAEY